jgi:SAM-dependent methyltransferase
MAQEFAMHVTYRERKLASGYPNLERLAFEKFADTQERHRQTDQGIDRQLIYLNRLVELGTGSVAVVGCGPRPHIINLLLEKGYNAVAIEPIPAFVGSAREFLGQPDRVLPGSAENLPLPDGSQHLVYAKSVLEHVDSPSRSVSEMFRVLAPGGIAFVSTTNRWMIGRSDEFNVRFFQWLPPVVKEAFVFQHLHYEPQLANYTERPAVHWFSFADLCMLGREAGFAQFYSPLDWIRAEDPPVARSALRRLLLASIRRSPWLRATALLFTRHGCTIAMLKRPREDGCAADVRAGASELAPGSDPARRP